MSEEIVAISQEKPIKKTRDSNIELFRIITMLLIVAHHYVVNSGLTAADGPIYADPLSWRSIFLLVFGAWGKIGINCFVLITGYFMCKSNITAKKFAKLFFEWMFYRVIIGAIFWISGYEAVTLKSVVLTLIPITSIQTNFTSCFIIFFLMIPFLNVLVSHMTEKQHILLLLLCGVTLVMIGTVHRVTFNYVTWFVVLYLIASYISLYPKKVFQRTWVWGCMTLISVLLSAISVIACAWFGARTDRMMAYYFVSDSNTVLAVLTGICSFLFFKNLSIKNSRIINAIAASTFGVFLIHANSDAMRRWLWQDLLKNVDRYESSLLPLYAIGSVLAVFFVCIIIDQIRIHLIEKPFFRIWDKHWDKVVAKCKKVEERISSSLDVQE